jgi:uncharacterized protein (TIGR02145 family)
MKFRLLAITLLAALAVVGCTQDEEIVNNRFALLSDDVDMGSDKLTFGSDQQTITIDVLTEDPNGKWNVSTPAQVSWLSYSSKGNKLTLTIGANDQSNEIRTSWIEFSMGDNKRKIELEQNYLRKDFTLSSDDVDLSSDKLTFDFEQRSVEIDVTPQDPKVKWNVNIPFEESWLSYSRKGNKLTLTMGANDKVDEVRTSWIEFSLGDNKRRIVVEQDYLHTLDFTNSTMTIAAAANSSLSLPYTGNVAVANLTVTTDPADVSWIGNLTATKGAVTAAVQKNSSYTESRSVTIILSGEGKQTTMTLTQGEDVDDDFTLSTGGSAISGDELPLSYEGQSVTINVTLDDGTDRWTVEYPTESTWLTCNRAEGQLSVTVTANDQSNEVRTASIKFTKGANSRTIVVEQDYLRKLAFTDSTMSVGAGANSSLSLPFTGNVALANLIITTNPTDVSWLTGLTATAGAVTGSLQRNSSLDDDREVTITLSGEGKQTTLTLTQDKLSGYPYVISLSAADWDEALIYEIWDETHNIKVGELCKEYLRKYDATAAEDIVNLRAVVAYPMLKSGGVDLANGYVLDNGGEVTWNTAITSSTSPTDYITSYAAGTLDAAPTTIYYGEGRPRMSETAFEGVPTEELVNATLKPYIVTDERSGAANTALQTTESYTYKVVKVGTQYWMAENLKTTRFRDGTNIPTNTGTNDWKVGGGKPYTPGCVLADVDGGAVSDANSLDDAAVAAKNLYGVQYNFHAVINQSAVSDVAMDPQSFTDELSPEGWSVPTKEEFERMIYYVGQPAEWGSLLNGTGASGERAKGLYLPQISGTDIGPTGKKGTNETGLSMDGANRWRTRTGGYSSGTQFMTMSGYSFSTQTASSTTPAHAITLFSTYINATSSDNLRTIFYVGGNFGMTTAGVNVRCIRK